MHDTTFYFENSFTILLSKESYEKLSREIEAYRCKQCGERLVVVQMMDGCFISCSGGIYNGHKTGYDLHMDFPRYEKEAYIEEIKE